MLVSSLQSQEAQCHSEVRIASMSATLHAQTQKMRVVLFVHGYSDESHLPVPMAKTMPMTMTTPSVASASDRGTGINGNRDSSSHGSSYSRNNSTTAAVWT